MKSIEKMKIKLQIKKKLNLIIKMEKNNLILISKYLNLGVFQKSKVLVQKILLQQNIKHLMTSQNPKLLLQDVALITFANRLTRIKVK